MKSFERLYKVRKIIDDLIAWMKEAENLTPDEYKLLIRALEESVKEKEKKDV